MRISKKLAISAAAIMATATMAITASAAGVSSGAIYMMDASSDTAKAAIGLTNSLDTVVVTLEGENNTYNFLVPAEGAAKIEDLPVDNYKIKLANKSPRGIYKLYTNSEGKVQGILFGKNHTGCNLSGDVIEVTDAENCSFELAFKLDISKTHRGYEDMEHSIATPKM